MAYKLQLKRGLLSALPIGISGEPLFTTDTNDLYISNGTTNQKFQKFIASGTSSQFLKGDGSLDSITYQPLLTNPVTGTGTTNYLPKWTSGSVIGNSIITDSGSIVTVGGVLTVTAANINLSNNYNLTGRNAANTLNLPLIGRNGSDRIDIDVDGYGTTIGGSGTIVLNPTGGNVGIGTASPAYRLDVNRSSLGAIAQFITTDGTYNPRLLINGTAEGIQLFATYSSGAEALMFGTANTERMRLTSNLIIGSNSDNGNRLQVNGVADALSFLVPNGGYYKAIRSSGSLVIDLLGIESGTDNTRLLITGDFNIKNGSATTLMNMTALGVTTFLSSVTASSFIKSGGTSAQILAADGSVITAGTNITISGGTISSSGGGGGSVDELQVALLSQVYG